MGCFLYCQCHIPDIVLHGSSQLVPMPCSRHGLTGDLSSRCQRHVRDMVLHGTSHNLNNANAMSQTWSYMGSHSLNVITFVSDTFLMFQRDFLS
ncbi:hypothetical protein Gotur_001442, partial [Gossypium turneri]